MHIPQVEIEPTSIDWTDRPRRYFNPNELEVLITLVRSVQPRGVLEFGVNVGRTAQVILEYCPTVTHYEGVDVPMGYVTEKEVQRREVPAVAGEMVLDDPRFRLLVRPTGSHELTAADLSPCDAVFIDGDHSRKGVENDSALALKLVRPGGIVIFHDYHQLGTVDVRDVLDELFTAGWDLQHVKDTWLVYRMF